MQSRCYMNQQLYEAHQRRQLYAAAVLSNGSGSERSMKASPADLSWWPTICFRTTQNDLGSYCWGLAVNRARPWVVAEESIHVFVNFLDVVEKFSPSPQERQCQEPDEEPDDEEAKAD